MKKNPKHFNERQKVCLLEKNRKIQKTNKKQIKNKNEGDKFGMLHTYISLVYRNKYLFIT